MAGRRTPAPTQTPPICDVHGDNLDHKDLGSKTLTFVATPSSAFAKRQVAEQITTSPTTTPPAAAAGLVTAFGSRRAASPEREQDAAPFAGSGRHPRYRKEIVGRQGQSRNTQAASKTAAVKEGASGSGSTMAPETAARPSRWILINRIGAKTTRPGAPKNRTSLQDPRRTQYHGGPESEIPNSSRSASGGGSRWKILNVEKNAARAFRRARNSAELAEMKRQARKQRWGGLKAVRQTTSIFMHALNVGSNDVDDETSSSSTGDEGTGAGTGGTGSENPSSIWHESSDSDCFSSSDMSDLDQEVSVRAHARTQWQTMRNCILATVSLNGCLDIPTASGSVRKEAVSEQFCRLQGNQRGSRNRAAGVSDISHLACGQ